MTKPVFRVFGFEDATCTEQYCGCETRTETTSIRLAILPDHSKGGENGDISELDDDTDEHAKPHSHAVEATVTIQVKDLIPALREAVSNRLAWIHDFQDDPIVVSKDMYDVLIAYQNIRRAA